MGLSHRVVRWQRIKFNVSRRLRHAENIVMGMTFRRLPAGGLGRVKKR